MSPMDTMYCYSCTTNTDSDTDTDSEVDAMCVVSPSNAEVLNALPKLVRIQRRPTQGTALRRSYQSIVNPNPTTNANNNNNTNTNTNTNQSIIPKNTPWNEKLLRMSNIASLLCVIDCTVLPLVTILLPLLGIGVVASPEREEWLHHLGHTVALNFVLPVGSLATTMNHTIHKKTSLTLLSILGLTLTYFANSSCHSDNNPASLLLPHAILHLLHHDRFTHRLVNVTGCALLLGSNYFGRRSVDGINTSGCSGVGVGDLSGGIFDGFCFCFGGSRRSSVKRHLE